MLATFVVGIEIEANPDEAQDRGRDVIVRVPLRVAREHHAKVRRLSQRRLKALLRTVPIYATLLDEYPDARVET